MRRRSAGLASKVPDGSDPSTLAWPSRCPAAPRRRHRHPAAQRSWSRSFAPGDMFLTGSSPVSSALLKVLHWDLTVLAGPGHRIPRGSSVRHERGDCKLNGVTSETEETPDD